MNAMELRDVSFQYGDRPILRGISFHMARGECVALLGPNAAGKTTLLRLITRTLVPQSGRILLAERDVRHFRVRELARRIAVVPQQFSVPFAFTVQEIVSLGRTPHIPFLRGSSLRDREAAEEAMRVTGTLHLAAREFNKLSGGERQRVMIAMALAQEPSILLMDEPTQQLDITRQAEILDLICALSSHRGLTVLATIHDLNLAARFFKRLLVLRQGSLCADGDPANVLRQDFLREVYAGEVTVTEVHGAPVVLPVSHANTTARSRL